VQYRLAYTYNKQTTVFPGSFGDPKGSLSFSLTNSSNNKKLKLNFSGNYQLDKNELPDYDVSAYTNLWPNAPALYNEDGSLNWATDPATGFPTWENPLAYLNAKYKRQVNNLVSSVGISYQLLSGFDIKLNGGFTSMQSNEIRTNPASLFAPANLPFIVRSSEFANSEANGWIVEPQLNYKVSSTVGNFNLLVGATVQENSSKAQSIQARGFNSDLVLEDSKAAPNVTVLSTTDATYKYNAVFARFNYDYRNKYLMDLTARRDGTSRFGPDKQFANFGAVGLGWIFSKENFISNNIPILSFGKLRMSYGTTGSDQVGDYRFLNLYRYVSYTLPYQNTLSLSIDGLYNASLAWEETRKLEVAMELGFWKDRIFIGGSYFRNRSSNQLTAYQLPYNTGSPSVPANLDATIQNWGWEFVINTNNIQSKTIRWNSGVNFTIVRNKLTELSPSAYFIDKRLLGQSLSTRYVYSFMGVDPITGQYQFSDGQGGTTFKPDTAFDPVTKNLLTQHAVDQNVKFYGGFQNSISWKNIQLDFLFQFVKRFGISNQRGQYPGNFDFKNQPVSVLNRWQKPGDDAPVQRFNQDYNLFGTYLYSMNSDGAITDASFIRLKNISLSYQLQTKWKRGLLFQNARIYTQAQNLFTITGYDGIDPETQSLTSLPPLQMWTIGIQLTL
jgi:TonB-linked SusC/RagA family outer membrane protein